jgi:hypothetical protein
MILGSELWLKNVAILEYFHPLAAAGKLLDRIGKMRLTSVQETGGNTDKNGLYAGSPYRRKAGEDIGGDKNAYL